MESDRWSIIVDDCRAALARIEDASVDAVVTDPPYELGFMGKRWDASGIAFDADMWRSVLRVLKPGGHLLAFGGTRTSHRMVCAIEDAAFEIRDSIGWMYGSGFPKSLNVHKAIGGGASGGRWQGWGTALKPALEPICVARKPLCGTVAENVTAHGTGAINVEASRIPMSTEDACAIENMGGFGKSAYLRHPGTALNLSVNPMPTQDAKAHALGRWPANVILDDAAARMIDAQAGECVSRFFYVAKPDGAERDAGLEGLPIWSGGGATDREDGTAGLSSPRAGAGRNGGRRNIHPTVKPIDLMRYLCRLVTPPGGLVLDPFAGSGTTGIGALIEGFRFVGIESDTPHAYIAWHRLSYWSERSVAPTTRARPTRNAVPHQPSLFKLPSEAA